MAEIYTGGGLPLRTRMDLCSDLFVLRDKINTADAAHKINVGVMAGRRVAAIRRILLGHAGLTLADELLAPGMAAKRIQEALDAVKDKPEHERAATATYAIGIMQTIELIQNAEKRIGIDNVPPEFDMELKQAVYALSPIGERVDPVIDHFIGIGALGDGVREELAKASAGGSSEGEMVSSFTRMKSEAYEKVVQEQKEIYAKYVTDRNAVGADQQKLDALYAEYSRYITEVFTPIEAARREVMAAELKRTNNAYATVGKKIIAGVIDTSPITQDAAEKWANAQEITKQAVTRLKTIKYPVDQVRSDMAEFYRFTGGRLARVRIHSKGDRRANATDIEAHGQVGTINLDGNFSKRTLWHELAHHMEADPVAKMASGRFIRRLSVDGKSYSLRSLTQNPGYRRNEIAYKGNFFSPYVGKIYNDGITEVFSMGVESFSSPELLARRAAEDPQTLEFIAGFVKAPVDPLAQAHMALREIVTAMKEDAAEATNDLVDGQLKKLASTAEITPYTDTQWQRDSGWDWELSKYKQIGRLGDSGYYLLSGKVKNYDTKRMCSGFVLAKTEPYGDRTSLQQHIIPGTDMSIVLGMYAVFRKKGKMPHYTEMKNAAFLREQALQ